MIKLKNFQLTTSVIQSPMAGCTDLAFRLLARSYGMQFAFLEMVAADPLVRQTKKTLHLLKSTEIDRPLGAQIVGCDPFLMGEAAAIIEDLGFDLLDINLGCPVPKVVSPGSGSALLKSPEKARQIFNHVIDRVKRIPVTVKMRKGFADPSGQEAVQIAKIAEDEGIAAVTVHGRTRLQGYAGSCDWNSIATVKQAVHIPVFGNGDVATAANAVELMTATGCDGVMVGRGALGNPWLYRSIDAAASGNDLPNAPSFDAIQKAALRHLELEAEFEGERIATLKLRRVLCWYFRNTPGINKLRTMINRATSTATLRDLIMDFHPDV